MLRLSSLDVEVRGNFGISCFVRLHFIVKLEVISEYHAASVFTLWWS